MKLRYPNNTIVPTYICNQCISDVGYIRRVYNDTYPNIRVIYEELVIQVAATAQLSNSATGQFIQLFI